ncbi:MAG: hypothetical protein DWH91_11705 [Planctomycetota bacterium]|nr:MAG: hypothetical protein DWH91_11705 [Planctomycetota bacterium]
MNRTHLTILLFAGLVLSWTGSVLAQNTTGTMVRGRLSQMEATSQRMRVVDLQKVQPEESLTVIAVIGEVKSPTVFLTRQSNVSLKTLIEKAGGQSEQSIGSFRILEYGQAREIISLERDPLRKIHSGQVVLVVPRGGIPAHSSSSRAPSRYILIHGLAEVPLILQLNDSISTLRDFTRSLGQPDENLSRTVVASPQGRWVENADVRMPNGTVVLFDPRIVVKEGVQLALMRGLKFLPEVSLDNPENPVAPPPPTTSAPPATLPTTPQNEPEQLIPGDIQPTSDEIRNLSLEPLWLPVEEEPAAPNSSKESPPGNVPLMMPRGWKIDAPAVEGDGDNASVAPSIERTSAQRDSHATIRQASAAQIQPNRELPEGSYRRLPSQTPLQAPPPPGTSARLSRYSPAGPNPYWIGFVALFAGIVIGLGVVLARAPRETEPASLVDEARARESLPQTAVVGRTPPADEAQQMLQRLIINRVPLVEEAPELPKSRQLHGPAVGAQRMILDAAHEGVAGPHFAVPSPRDTREVELRLRSLMRESRLQHSVVASPTGGSIEEIPSQMARTVRTERISPLERALRSVEQGEIQ